MVEIMWVRGSLSGEGKGMGEGASICARWADLVANHQQVNNISVAGIRRHLAGIPVAVF
jgi:hypothetical protein